MVPFTKINVKNRDLHAIYVKISSVMNEIDICDSWYFLINCAVFFSVLLFFFFAPTHKSMNTAWDSKIPFSKTHLLMILLFAIIVIFSGDLIVLKKQADFNLAKMISENRKGYSDMSSLLQVK